MSTDARLSTRARLAFALLVLLMASAGLGDVGLLSLARHRERAARTIEIRDPRYPCGNVCIATVSHLLDQPITLGQTTRALPVDPEGVSSLLEVQHALVELGFSVRGIKLDGLRQLGECPSPAILHVRGRHFVVAMPAKGGRVVVIDPPRLPTAYETDAPELQWDGVCLLVTRSEPAIDAALQALGVHESRRNGRHNGH